MMGWILTGYAVGVLITAVVLAGHARGGGQPVDASAAFSVIVLSLAWPIFWPFILVVSVEAPK